MIICKADCLTSGAKSKQRSFRLRSTAVHNSSNSSYDVPWPHTLVKLSANCQIKPTDTKLIFYSVVF